MTLEAWQKLRQKVKKEKEETKRSVHEMARIKLGTLCKVEQWMNELESKNEN